MTGREKAEALYKTAVEEYLLKVRKIAETPNQGRLDVMTVLAESIEVVRNEFLVRRSEAFRVLSPPPNGKRPTS